MARYRLTEFADQKIATIYEYSLLKFGEKQADAYFLGMHDLFDLLAANPLMGREESELGEGIRRFLYEAHLVVYRQTVDSILILDVLGLRQKRQP